MVDAKAVRRRHLERLGSHSYGGLVRQHLKGIPSVALIGAGHLASEIVPWLIGKAQLTLFCRDPLSARGLVDKYPQINLEQFTTAHAGHGSGAGSGDTALVIAAPLTSREIESWVVCSRALRAVLDLRAEYDRSIRVSFLYWLRGVFRDGKR